MTFDELLESKGYSQSDITSAPREREDELARIIANKYSPSYFTGNFSNFDELAAEYVNEEKDPARLEAFRNMNPMEQRSFVFENYDDIVKNSRSDRLPSYAKAKDQGKEVLSEYHNNTKQKLRDELERIKGYATQYDLRMQRYKDLLGVGGFTHQDLNDYITSGGKTLPSGARGSEQIGISPNVEYTAFMLGKSPLDIVTSELIPEVGEMYRTEPLVDRFGTAPAATRYANKRSYARRPIAEDIVGMGVRALGIPYANDMEQAREAGAIAHDEAWNPMQSGIGYGLLNLGSSAFDAATSVYAPKYLSKISGLVGNSIMGGLQGAKSSLEGERRAYADPSAPFLGAVLGGGIGSVPYLFNRFAPRYGKAAIDRLEGDLRGMKGELASTASEASRWDKFLRNTESLENSIAREQQKLSEASVKPLNIVEGDRNLSIMFDEPSVSGYRSYARGSGLTRPIDDFSSNPEDVLKWGQNVRTELMESNPAVRGASPWETRQTFIPPDEVRLQNLQKADGIDTRSPFAQLSQETLYDMPGDKYVLGTQELSNERLAMLADYYAKDQRYADQLARLGFSEMPIAQKADIGRAIMEAGRNWQDKPIADLAWKTEITDADRVNAFNSYMQRQFPDGVPPTNSPAFQRAQAQFNEKMNLALSTPAREFGEVMPTGSVSDTRAFKDTKKIIEKNTLLSEDAKKSMLGELDALGQKGTTLAQAGQTLADLNKNANFNSSLTAADFEGMLRREMTPNAVRKGTLEYSKAIIDAEKELKALTDRQAELTSKMMKTLNSKGKVKGKVESYARELTDIRDRIGGLEETIDSRRKALQGRQKYVVGASGVLGRSVGATTYANTRQLPEDERLVSPVNRSQTTLSDIERIPYLGKVLDIVPAFANSPLRQLRNYGSFNIKGGDAQ